MVMYDVIDYIQSCVDSDTDLPEGINVLEAYKYSHQPKSTEIQVQEIDHSEFERFTTFEDGKIFITPLQFNVYAKQTTIGNEAVSAQKAANILAEKVVGWLNVMDLHTAIPEVISVRNGTYASSVPLDSGTALYGAVVRVDIYIE